MTLAVLDGAILIVALPAMARDLAVRPSEAIFVVIFGAAPREHAVAVVTAL